MPATTMTTSAVGELVDRPEQAVDAGDADVGEAVGVDAVGGEDRGALVGDGEVGGAGGGEHDREARSSRRGAGRQTTVSPMRSPPGLAASAIAAWSSSTRVSRMGRSPTDEQLGDDGRALVGCLARPVDRLGQSLAHGAVVVDPGVAEIGEREAAQLR